MLNSFPLSSERGTGFLKYFTTFVEACPLSWLVNGVSL